MSAVVIARLLDARSFVTTNELGDKTTEGTLRPLFRLRKEGYGPGHDAASSSASTCSGVMAAARSRDRRRSTTRP